MIQFIYEVKRRLGEKHNAPSIGYPIEIEPSCNNNLREQIAKVKKTKNVL